VSPRARLLLIAPLVLLGACGAPPEPLPGSPPYAPPPSAAVTAPAATAPAATGPAVPPPATTYAMPTFAPPPTYVPRPAPTSTAAGTTGPLTVPARPTPTHAPKCTGSPTSAQILALVKGLDSIPPAASLEVAEGPFCAGGWSFTTVTIAGSDSDDLMVLTTGANGTLTLFSAGSDVCSTKVQTGAPPGVRVLACGF
jgi:hypothetical protein